MSEEPKSIWKKSWKGPDGILLWLIMLLVAAFVVFFSIGVISGIENGMEKLAAFALLYALCLVLGGVLIIAFIRWIFCRHNFKRFLFGCACFATLVALFYAEEDWRGLHDWNKFKREWEAKGEKFDFKDFVPSPVPDDQNFALMPIVASSYAAMLDKGGHEIKPRNTNVVDRLQMSVTDSNGDGPTNGYWARATKTDLSGWQNYYRTLATKTNEFPVAPLPQSPAQDVLLALSKYDSTIEELREASKLPYSRFPLEYDKDDPAAILLPHLAALKRCALVLRLRAIAELQNGESDKALDDVKLMIYLINSIRTEPVLISHLVRIAMAEITLQPVYEGLAEHRWSDAQLAALDAELGKLDFLADYEFSMRGERIFGISITEYLRRTRNLQALDIATDGGYSNPFQNLGFHLLPSAFFYQNELALARMSQQWLLPMVDSENRMVSPKIVRQNQIAAEDELKHGWPYNILARMTFPAVNSVVKKYVREQSSIDMARVAIALERYRLARGNFPDSLDALAPQFMGKIPHDIINGQPLKYRRTDDGQFILYSVGWNETDDGGIVVLQKGSSAAVDIDKGDWVWRYPAK